MSTPKVIRHQRGGCPTSRRQMTCVNIYLRHLVTATSIVSLFHALAADVKDRETETEVCNFQHTIIMRNRYVENFQGRREIGGQYIA